RGAVPALLRRAQRRGPGGREGERRQAGGDLRAGEGQPHHVVGPQQARRHLLTMATGPLAGTRIVEMAGLGPAPFAGMVLSDMGAEILRVDKPPSAYRLFDPTGDVLGRGRRSVAVDVKHPDGTEVVLRLIAQADVLLDPYRPGVLERLGLGPDECLARNPRL